MSFFKFLDNKYRNFTLDNQIEFSLAKEGYQQATHAWVLTIRKFFKAVRIVTLPFEYLLQKACLLSKDVSYETRYEELKQYTEKVLRAAKEAEQAGKPLPPNPEALLQPDSVKATE